MSWWSIITTKGRLLQDVCVEYAKDELRIISPALEEGEEPAVLIDHLQNKARLSAPFEECQRLAVLHQYELCYPRNRGPSFIERILSFKHQSENSPISLKRDGD
jgi:hypothetical protein